MAKRASGAILALAWILRCVGSAALVSDVPRKRPEQDDFNARLHWRE